MLYYFWFWLILHPPNFQYKKIIKKGISSVFRINFLMTYANCNKKVLHKCQFKKKVPPSSTLIYKQGFAEISQINFRINPSCNHLQWGLYISHAYARSLWGNLNTRSGLFFYILWKKIMVNRDNRIHEDKYNDCSCICFHAFGDPGLQQKKILQ